MATTAITPIAQTLHTRSADLLGVGTVATTPSDGWVVTPTAKAAAGAMFFLFEADATGDTVVFTVGDNPPSHLKGLGSYSLVLAASDIRGVWIEAARFLQDDGTIVITCTDAGTMCYVMVPPGAIGGGTLIA